MVILVTGGAGYIGSHTVLTLLELNKNMVVLNSRSPEGTQSDLSFQSNR
jgi:UDP-glucose 4-epimerase